MDIIIAIYVSLTIMGALSIFSFYAAFIRHFGWGLYLEASRPPDIWTGIYELILMPLNLPFLGARRLLDAPGYNEMLVGSTLMTFEVLADSGEVEVPMAEIVEWLQETLVEPEAEVEPE